jgi:predicted  nucleic acid-binding Zn-ribbon protein
MVDPLSQNPKWEDCKYKIVSYRLITNKNNMSEYNCKSDLDKELKKIWKDFDDKSGSSHKKMAEKLKDFRHEKEEMESEINQAIIYYKNKIEELEQKPIMTPEVAKELDELRELGEAVKILLNYK